MNILDKIITNKKTEIINISENDNENITKANHSFYDAISKSKISIIAELKQKSPSEGVLCEDYNPVSIATDYKNGGAIALSILTDKVFFGGDFLDISKVKQNINIPILCKDFIISKKQITKARLSGADAILLIVRILSDEQLKILYDYAYDLGMDILVEIFDKEDIKRILDFNFPLIGINNRNLDTLKMNKKNAYDLSELIPKKTLVISLSGATNPQETNKLANVFDGVLLGTALMKSNNSCQFIRESMQ